MAVHIADAVIMLMLDMSQFEAAISQAEGRLQALGAQAQAVAGQVAAAGQAAQAAGGAGGGGGGVGGGVGGGGGSWIPSNMDAILDNLTPGAASLRHSIVTASSPNSPGGRGWTLGEDIGAAVSFASNYIPGNSVWAEAARTGGTMVGMSLMEGAGKGVEEGKTAFNDAVTKAVNDAFEAGKRAAEAESPSRRSAREIGGPIMQGVELSILAGAPAVANAMMTSLGFAFNQWKAVTFGGTHVGAGLNIVQNPGGMLGGGLGGYLGQLGTAMQIGMIQAQPTNLGEASRAFLGQFPTQIKNFGMDLLGGALESILPGWAAGPLGDMIGTYFGLKPIIAAQDALAPSKSADMGGFADYPYGGGQFVFNNTFNGVGNFTDTEREVQLGILQSMRRLGAY